MYENMDKVQKYINKYYYSQAYQTYIPIVVLKIVKSRKVDHHAGGKWFIHGPKRRNENQLLSLEHPC